MSEQNDNLSSNGKRGTGKPANAGKGAGSGPGRVQRRAKSSQPRTGKAGVTGGKRPKRPCGAHVGSDKRSMWVLDESTGTPRVVRVRRGEEPRYAGMPTLTAPRGTAAPGAEAFYAPASLPKGFQVGNPVPVRQLDARIESHLARVLGETVPAEALKQSRKEVLAALRRSPDPDRAARGMSDALAAGATVEAALAAGLEFGARRLQFRPEPAALAYPAEKAFSVNQRIGLAHAATLARTDAAGRLDAFIKPLGGQGGTFVSLAVAGAAPEAAAPLAPPVKPVTLLDPDDDTVSFASAMGLKQGFLHAVTSAVAGLGPDSTVEELNAAADKAAALVDALEMHAHDFAGDESLGVFIHEMVNKLAPVGMGVFTLSTLAERGGSQERAQKVRDSVASAFTALHKTAVETVALYEQAPSQPSPAESDHGSPAMELADALRAAGASPRIEVQGDRVFVRATFRDADPVAVAAALGVAPTQTVTVDDDGRPVLSIGTTYRSGSWSGERTVDLAGTRTGTEALIRHHLESADEQDTYELSRFYEKGAAPGDPPFEKALPALLLEASGPVKSLGELQVRLSALQPEDVLPPALVARANSLPQTAHSSTLGPLPVWYRDREAVELLVETVLHVGDPRIAALPTEVAGRPATVAVARFDDKDRISRVEQVAVSQLQQRHVAFVNRRFDNPVDALAEAVRLEVATGAAAAAAQHAAAEGIAYAPSSDPKQATDEQQAVERVGFYAHTQPRRDLGAVATALHVLSARPEVAAAVSPETRAVMVESSATLRNYGTMAREIAMRGEFRRVEEDGSETVWTSVDQLRSPWPSPLKGEPKGSRDRARQEAYEAERDRLASALGEALSAAAGRPLTPAEVDDAVVKVMDAARRAPSYAKRLASAAVDFDRRHFNGAVDGPGIF